MSAPRYAYGPGSAGSGPGTRRAPESTTSWDEDSSSVVPAGRAEKAPIRDTRGPEVSNSSRDLTRDTSYNSYGQGGGGGVTFVPRKKDGEEEERYRTDGSSTTDAEGPRQASYDFRYPAYAEKVEWSCDESGSWQKISFLFLVLAFMGHAIAVCTPYWAVSYYGDAMSVYEGVWLSCYREQGVGRWVCSTYDTIRGLFQQPSWYEASQVCAVLSVILLIPALVAATLYSYVVALSGRSRASWVLVCFLGGAGLCGFLSFVVFGAGYPLDQEFPPGNARLHASFGLQIISFVFCCLSLGAHLRDSYTTLRVWDSNRDKDRDGVRPVVVSSSSRNVAAPPASASSTRGPYVTSGRVGDVNKDPAPARQSHVPKLPSFSLPKFPSALSRFRPGGGGGSGGGAVKPTAPPASDYPDVRREASGVERLPPHSQSGGPSSHSQQRGGGTAYRSYAAPPSSGGGSVSGYDSVV